MTREGLEKIGTSERCEGVGAGLSAGRSYSLAVRAINAAGVRPCDSLIFWTILCLHMPYNYVKFKFLPLN